MIFAGTTVTTGTPICYGRVFVYIISRLVAFFHYLNQMN